MTSESSSVLVVRPMHEGDHNYVYQTWLADLRDSDPSFLPNDLWFPAHRECIRRTLESPKVQAFVLCSTLCEDDIVGYLIRDEDYLHWVHIRRGRWRDKGLAKKLLLDTNSQALALAWRSKGSSKLKQPCLSRQARLAWAQR